MAYLSCLAFLALVAVLTLRSDAAKSERELRRDIFRDYDKLVRPVKNASNTVTVSMSISPLAIKSMNEKEMILVMDALMLMKWSDDYLQWDPTEYDNITLLRIAPEELWKPDLALYTATPDTSYFPVVNTQVILYHTGQITWVPPFTLRTRCPQPFGSHVSERTSLECKIQIGSWTYRAKSMDIQLTTDKVDLTDFVDSNREWKLVTVVSNREGRTYYCCPDDVYPLIRFNVTLKRRNSYLPPQPIMMAETDS